MSKYLLILNLFISSAISFFSIKLFFPTFKKRWMIVPNSRSSHYEPIPIGGGLVFSTIGVIGSLIYKDYSFLIFVPLLIIGHLDDCKGISAIKRFWAQLITFVIFMSLKINSIFLNFWELNLNSKLGLLILLAIIFLALVNFCNFSDGIDGLLGGTALIIFSTIMLVNQNQNNIVFLLGGMLGFLIWNWCPAKIFMGDAGSYFIGSIYFYLIINASTFVQGICFLFLGTPIFADILITLFRRFFAGEAIFRPHKLNLFHRLNQAGMSHTNVSSIYIVSTLIICLSYLLLGVKFLILSVIMISIFAIYLDQRVAISFNESLIKGRINKQI